MTKFIINRRGTTSTGTGGEIYTDIRNVITITDDLILNRIINLAYIPISNSVHVQYNGQSLVYNRDYTLTGAVVTISVELELFLNDVLQIQYVKLG